jgi:ankyrin repeat protein
MSPTEGIGSNSQLLKLPNELFLEVASYFEGFKDLNSLACTSRFLHTIFNTQLYRRAVAADDIVLDDIVRWVLSGYRLASLTLLLDNGLSVNHTGQFADDKQCEGLGMRSWYADTMLLFLSLLDDKERSVPLARLLIQRGAHIDATGDKFSKTVLHKAISHGNCPIVALLLAHGADVNAADNAGLRAMHLVCDNLNYCAEMAHSLMAHCADVTAADNALRALRDKFNDSAEIVHLLIAHGADIEARSASGDTPLIRSSQYSPPVMTALLEHGADAGVHNNHGETPLHYASRWFEDEHYELAKSLLENGAKINATDQAGRRALHWLLESHPGDPLFMAKFLLENGADVNAISDEGLSPLHGATTDCPDRVDVVELLLEHGAIINAIGPRGLTPLHYLLSYYSPGNANELVAIADVLLKNGADVNAVCDEGFSPLQRALDIGCEADLVGLLLAYGADVSVLDAGDRIQLSRVMGEQTPSMNGN